MVEVKLEHAFRVPEESCFSFILQVQRVHPVVVIEAAFATEATRGLAIHVVKIKGIFVAPKKSGVSFNICKMNLPLIQ
jgi:hypothetical protein